MALTLADRIKQYTTSTGTGDVSFTGTPTGFASFDSALTTGDLTYYCIEENDKWEVGVGTYGSDNMVRSEVLASSNGGSHVDLGGSGVVFITYPADKATLLNENGQYVLGASGLLFSNGTVVKDAKLVELTDVALSGTVVSTHVLALNNTNKSLLLGDVTGPSNSNNTLIGYGAGSGITSATNNVAVGTESAIANNAGTENVSIGVLSGPSETMYTNPASYVVSIGYKAGSRAKSEVTALGHQAGMAAYETGFVAVGSAAGSGIGSYSVGVGKEAAHGMSSDYVVAVGHQAAKGAAGESSVWVGNMAGASASSSTKSIGIGYQAGKSSSATDSIYIGQSAGQSSSDDDYLYISNGPPSSSRTLIKGDMQSKRLAVGAADITLEDTFYIGIASSVDKGLVVRSAVGQSDDLTQWQTSAGGSLASVSSLGVITANQVVASGQGLKFSTSQVPTTTTNTLYGFGGTLYWGLSPVTAPSGAPESVAFYSSTKAAIYSDDFKFDDNGKTLTVGNVCLDNNFIGINDVGKIKVGSYPSISDGITESDYSVILGYYAAVLASGSPYSFLAGDHVAYKALNFNNSQSIGSWSAAWASGSRNVYIGDAAGVYATGNYNVFIGDRAGKDCVGSQNIEIVASGDNSFSPLNGHSNKLHIGQTIIGDTDARKLAFGLVGSSNVNPDATVEIFPKTDDLALKVHGSGEFASGVALPSAVPASTTNMLYNDAGTLKFNGSAIGGGGGDVTTAQLTYVSGIAVYGSGQAQSLGYASGVAAYASGEALSLNAASGQAVYSSGVLTGGNPTFGDVQVGEYIYHNGDNDTYLRLRDNNINLVAGNWSAIKLEKSTGKIQLNNSNVDLDVQITALGGDVLLHTDATTKKVGINTATPAYDLDVFGHDAWAQVSGIIVGNSGAILANNAPAVTTNTLYSVGGSLYFNGSELASGGASAEATYASGEALSLNAASGQAVYASGQAIANEADIATNVTNIATNSARVTYASGLAITNELRVAYASGQAIANEADIATNVTNIATNSARVTYASGEALSLNAASGQAVYSSGVVTGGNPTFGNAHVGEYIYHNGDADTFIQFTNDEDRINIEAGGLNMIYMVQGSAGHDKVTINNNDVNIDFQVKGTIDTNLIRTDAANDKVGIGTDEPSYKLDVSGHDAWARASGIIVGNSGVVLANNAPAVTTNTLYNDGGTLSWNGSAVGGGSASAEATYASGEALSLNAASGQAVYASGQAIENESDIVATSGIANYASGLAITNELQVAYASGQAIANESDIVATSGIAAYASGMQLNGLADVSFGGTNLTRSFLVNSAPGSAPTHGTLGSDCSNNLAIGYDALNSITDATNNVALGSGVLTALTTGDGCVGIGQLALTSLTTGSANIGIGSYAGKGITTASTCIFIGSHAGEYAASGANNVALGFSMKGQSGLTNCSNNIAIGYNSLDKITTGNNNIAFGYGACQYGTDSDNNIALGQYAMTGDSVWPYSTTGNNNNVAIGQSTLSDITQGSQNIAIGRLAGTNVTTGSSNILLGYQAGQALTTEGSMLFIASAAESSNGTLIKGDMANKYLAIGKADVTLSTDPATLQVYSNGATDKVLLVQGIASQVDDLTSWQTSAGAVVAAMTPAGTLNTYGIVASGNAEFQAKVGIGTASPAYELDVFGHDAWARASGVIVGSSGIIMQDADLSHAITLKTPDVVSTSFTLPLPSGIGTNGQVLTTDSVQTYWSTVSASAAGSDGQIQYNNGGSALGGASRLYYNDTTNRLGIGTSSPDYGLDITGAGASGIIQASGLIVGVSGVIPNVTNTVDLGTSSVEFRNAYFDGTVTSDAFAGPLTGNADTATEATNVTVTANNSTNETVYPVFVDGATGTQGAETDTGFSYNPSTGQLIVERVRSTDDLTALTGQSGTVTIDASLSNYFTVAATGSITNLNITNAKLGQRILIRFVWAGDYTLASTSDTLIWPGGSVPDTTSGGVDVIGFLCTAASASNTFDAFIIGLDIKAP